jgi:CP family cyanate transporter-like MFS transporter
MQVTMPSAVRTWIPDRIAFGTAVYTNGLLIGEILPVMLTLPLVLPLVGSWEWGFAVWSAPVLVIAILVQIFAPTRASGATPVRVRWWPDWGNMLIWRLGFMLGTVNAMYFTANAFIPDFLRDHGEPEWISAALTGLNAGQLPASFVLLAFARQLQLKVWPIVSCGIFGTIATLMIIFGSGPMVVAGATLVGLCCASILMLVLALPPLLAEPDDVHRVTAAMFTISYSCAVIVPIISGAAWDLTGLAGAAFAPIAISGVLLIVLAPAILHVRRREAA